VPEAFEEYIVKIGQKSAVYENRLGDDYNKTVIE
jgi:hypothetical protein